MEEYLMQIKALNPSVQIKIDINNSLYFSQSPTTLILPQRVTCYKDTLVFPKFGSIKVKPMNEISAYSFDIDILPNLSSYNIYHTTKLNTDDLLKVYLQLFVDTDLLPHNAYESEASTIDVFYNHLKQEPNFNGKTIDASKRNELHQEIQGIAKTKNIYANPSSIQPGWDSYQSWHITGGTKPPEEALTHRFYLNISPELRHIFAQKLIQKYKDNQIPFYFKINLKANEKDGIVIYVPTKFLDKNIEILQEIDQEMPKLKRNSGTNHPFIFPINN